MDNNRGSAEFDENIENEIEALLGQTYAIRYSRLTLEKDIPASAAALSEVMTNGTDILITLGITSSQLLSNLNDYPIPCIAGIALDRTNKESTEIENYTYIQSPFSIEKDFEVFRSIYPFKRLGIFVEPQLRAGLEPFFNTFSNGFEMEFVSITDDPTQDIAQLTSAVDAIYFLPNLYDSVEKEKQLISGINARKLPSFSLIGRTDVEQGILASISPSDYVNVYARRIALNVMKILEGENPKDLPIQISGIEEDFVINTTTMKSIGLYPPLEVMSAASFVGLGNDMSGRQYTLAGAIAEGLDNNLSLRAERKNIDLQDQEVRIARSNLLPNADISTAVVTLDQETAEQLKAANQLNPQTEWTGNVGLTQLIFSEPVYANIAIQKLLLKAQEQGFLSMQLDLALDICTAYISYLQAQANLNIQNNNVQKTLSNLNVAKTQAKIGSISLADVHGLESQLAVNKSALYDAQTGIEQAKIRFNQLLNKPLDEDIALEEVGMGEALTFFVDPRIGETINNGYDISRFANFLIDYTLKHSPDIQQLEWSIKAQERSLLSNKRSLYMPQIAAQGSLDKTFGRYGTRIPDEVLEAGGIDPYRLSWNVGVNASLPIFQGNFRNLKIQRDKITLDQLATNKELLEQSFAANIRVALENLGNTYNDIVFTQQAEQSSEEFLKIIQELYREGATNIVTLLDAQNNSLSAQLNATFTRYQFIIDAITIERALNKIYLLSSQQEKDAFVDAYFDYIIQNDK